MRLEKFGLPLLAALQLLGEAADVAPVVEDAYFGAPV